MFSIIKNSVLGPRTMAQYIDKKNRKWNLYLVLLVLLCLLPTLLALAFSFHYNSNITRSIMTDLKRNEVINYIIEDNTLKPINNQTTPQSIKLSSFQVSILGVVAYPVMLVFDSTGEEYIQYLQSKSDISSSYLIVFTENKYDVILANVTKDSNGSRIINTEVTRSFNYNELNMDFSKGISRYDYNLEQGFNQIGQSIYNSYKSLLISTTVPYYICSQIFSFFFYPLVIAGLMFLFFRGINIKFGKFYKMALMSMTPFVLGNILSVLFNNIILYYIGNIGTLIYLFQLLRSYTLNKIIKQRGGQDLEL